MFTENASTCKRGGLLSRNWFRNIFHRSCKKYTYEFFNIAFNNIWFNMLQNSQWNYVRKSIISLHFYSWEQKLRLHQLLMLNMKLILFFTFANEIQIFGESFSNQPLWFDVQTKTDSNLWNEVSQQLDFGLGCGMLEFLCRGSGSVSAMQRQLTGSCD